MDAAPALTALASRPGPAREGDLAAGRRAVAQALALRPQSGRAWAEAALVQSLTASSSLQAVSDLLARSYAREAFLPGGGLWRTGWAADHWLYLDAGLKARVLDEAAWLQSLPRERGGRPDGGLGEGPAAVALSLRDVDTPS